MYEMSRQTGNVPEYRTLEVTERKFEIIDEKHQHEFSVNQKNTLPMHGQKHHHQSVHQAQAVHVEPNTKQSVSSSRQSRRLS